MSSASTFLYRQAQNKAPAVHQYIEDIQLDMAFWLPVLQRVEPTAAVLIQTITSPSISVSAGNFSQARTICVNLSVNPFPLRDQRTTALPR